MNEYFSHFICICLYFVELILKLISRNSNFARMTSIRSQKFQVTDLKNVHALDFKLSLTNGKIKTYVKPIFDQIDNFNVFFFFYNQSFQSSFYPWNLKCTSSRMLKDILKFVNKTASRIFV